MRRIKELDLSSRCTPVAFHIGQRGSSAADALPRPTLTASGGDLYPGRELQSKFRGQVEARRGRMNVDMPARGNGGNARFPFYGPLPAGRLWRFRGAGMIEFVWVRHPRAVREGSRGSVIRPTPD